MNESTDSVSEPGRPYWRSMNASISSREAWTSRTLRAVSMESRSARAMLCGSVVATVRASPEAATGITLSSRTTDTGRREITSGGMRWLRHRDPRPAPAAAAASSEPVPASLRAPRVERY